MSIDVATSSIWKLNGEGAGEIRGFIVVSSNAVSINYVNGVIVGEGRETLQRRSIFRHRYTVDIDDSRGREHEMLMIQVIGGEAEAPPGDVLCSRSIDMSDRVQEVLSYKERLPPVQFHVIDRHTVIVSVITLEPIQRSSHSLCADGEQVLQLMAVRGFREHSRPYHPNMIRKGGWRKRKDVEQLCGVLRNDDGMSLDSKVCSIRTTSAFLKTNDAARHVTSSDDEGIDPRQALQLRRQKVRRLRAKPAMIGNSLRRKLPFAEMLVTGSAEVHTMLNPNGWR